MFEAIGIVAVTLIAGFIVFLCIGIPYLGLGFGGPTTANIVCMVVGLIAAGFISFGWWVTIGENIHLQFG